jgi:hypothetical protein
MPSTVLYSHNLQDSRSRRNWYLGIPSESDVLKAAVPTYLKGLPVFFPGDEEIFIFQDPVFRNKKVGIS